MQTTQQILSNRNRQIRELALLLKCSIARASHIYYVIRNATDAERAYLMGE